jgi:hypothetical protein
MEFTPIPIIMGIIAIALVIWGFVKGTPSNEELFKEDSFEVLEDDFDDQYMAGYGIFSDDD